MPDQMSLTVEYIDLTPEERIARGQALAAAWRRRAAILEEQEERRKEMKEERETIEAEISALANVVRSGREERPVATAR